MHRLVVRALLLRLHSRTKPSRALLQQDVKYQSHQFQIKRIRRPHAPTACALVVVRRALVSRCKFLMSHLKREATLRSLRQLDNIQPMRLPKLHGMMVPIHLELSCLRRHRLQPQHCYQPEQQDRQTPLHDRLRVIHRIITASWRLLPQHFPHVT